MKKHSVTLAALLVLGLTVRAQTGRTETGSIEHGGRVRTFLMHTPPGYDGTAAVPLQLSFHGRGGTGTSQADLTHLNSVADARGFIVVYPDGVEQSWNNGAGVGSTEDPTAETLNVDDVGFVDALVTHMSERFKIDPNRIDVSGMSNGGFFSHRDGCQLSSRVAAIASVAGPMATAIEPSCQPIAPTAAMIVHGLADKVVPYYGGETLGGGSGLSAPKTAEKWATLNGCSNPTGTAPISRQVGEVVFRSYVNCQRPVVLVTVRDGGHTWPGGLQYSLFVGKTNRDIDASEEIWKFFAANPKR